MKRDLSDPKQLTTNRSSTDKTIIVNASSVAKQLVIDAEDSTHSIPRFLDQKDSPTDKLKMSDTGVFLPGIYNR